MLNSIKNILLKPLIDIKMLTMQFYYRNIKECIQKCWNTCMCSAVHKVGWFTYATHSIIIAAGALSQFNFSQSFFFLNNSNSTPFLELFLKYSPFYNWRIAANICNKPHFKISAFSSQAKKKANHQELSRYPSFFHDRQCF